METARFLEDSKRGICVFLASVLLWNPLAEASQIADFSGAARPASASAIVFAEQAIPAALALALKPFSVQRPAEVRRDARRLGTSSTLPVPFIVSAVLLAAEAYKAVAGDLSWNQTLRGHTSPLLVGLIGPVSPGWVKDAVADFAHDIRFAIHRGQINRATTALQLVTWAPMIVVFGMAWLGLVEATPAVIGVLIASIGIHVVPSNRLRARQQIDSLTKAWNRNHLELPSNSTEIPTGHLPRLFRRAIASGKPLSAIMVDVDKFKSVNDRFGHPAGDAVLAAVAQMLQEGLRPIDELIRYGGEEFLILLPDTDAQEAHAVAERLRASIERAPIAIGAGSPLTVTASFGVITTLQDPNPDDFVPRKLSAWLNAADAALYAAKESGRNRVVVGAFDRKAIERTLELPMPRESENIWRRFSQYVKSTYLRFDKQVQPGMLESQPTRALFAISSAAVPVILVMAWQGVLSPLSAFFSAFVTQEAIYRVWLQRFINAEIQDPLTGAWRRAFLGVGDEKGLLPSIHRRATEPQARYQPVSLVMLDIDFFKRVNDQYGHAAGDEVLRRVGAILSMTVRATDVVVRYGGEEFMIILPGADRHQALIAAEKILSAVREATIVVRPDQTIQVTASLGIAQGNDYGSVDSWIMAADKALYRAKQGGRNRIVSDNEGQDGSGDSGGTGASMGPRSSPPASSIPTPLQMRRFLEAA